MSLFFAPKTAQYCRVESVMAIKRCVSDRRKQHNTTVRQNTQAPAYNYSKNRMKNQTSRR